MAVLLALALTALGCRDGDVRQCLELLAAKRHEPAAERCRRAFEATGDPRAGAAAARALAALGRDDEVLAWRQRLAGSRQEGVAWELAGGVYRRRGEAEPAAAAYERALLLHRSAGDHRGAAESLQGLFLLAWRASDHRRALELARSAAEEAAQARDRSLQQAALRAIVVLLYDLGDLEGARRALDAAGALVDPEDRARRAELLSYEGAIRLDEERPALARAALEEALELGGADRPRNFYRSNHLNLVLANLALDDLERAERHLAAAWEHAEPDGSRRTALLYFQARLRARQGRHTEAAQALRTALADDPIPDWAWNLEDRLGRVEAARGDLPAAEAAYGRAIETVETMRGALGLDDLKAWLLERKRHPYEALFELQAEAGRTAEALATVERAKARTFLDAFLQAAVDPGAAPAPSKPVESQPPQPEPAAARLAVVEELLPAMSESPVVASRPIDQVLAAVGRRRALVYFQTDDRLWLLTLADERIAVRPLAASPDETAAMVSRYLARPDDDRAAAALGRLLLPADAFPEEGPPEPGARLFVVTDGLLGALPFAALRRSGRYLVEDFALTYVPSLGALAALGEAHPAAGSAPVVLGDPRGDLPAAGDEARQVAARLGVEAHTGAAATSARLAQAPRARVLHLATHAGVRPGGPWLALAGGDVGGATLLARRLAPRLVVLATCAGAARRGQGMWGSLGATFLAAGSRAVLASLWSLEDEAARRFILRFYAHGGAGDPAQALARTQRSFIAGGEPPSVWAPFVLLGI